MFFEMFWKGAVNNQPLVAKEQFMIEDKINSSKCYKGINLIDEITVIYENIDVVVHARN